MKSILLILLLALPAFHFAKAEDALTFKTRITPDHVSVPPKGAGTPVLVILEITNHSGGWIKINRHETPVPKIQTESGQKLRVGYSQDISLTVRAEEFVTLKPGATTYILSGCSLYWNKDILTLYSEMAQGSEWSVWNLRPGSYQVTLHYTGKDKHPFEPPPSFTEGAWSGDILSEPATFTIDPAPAE